MSDSRSAEVVILGNGRSRLEVSLPELAERFWMVGCNALYRDFLPDVLVSVDVGITREILEAKPDCWHIYARRWEVPRPPLCDQDGSEYPDRGWSCGPTAGSLTVDLFRYARTIHLVGMDLYPYPGDCPNNVYTGTTNYGDQKWPGHIASPGTQYWRALFLETPHLCWRWRRPWPGAEIPDLWEGIPNLEVFEGGIRIGWQ